MSSNQWTPINARANPTTPQTTSSGTPSSSTRRSTRVKTAVSYPKTPLRNKPKHRTPSSSTRRSTRVQTPASYPKTPLRNKSKRRTKKSPRIDEAESSSPKSAESVTKIGCDLMDDLIRTLGPDSDGDVPMSDKGYDSDETEEEDWFGMGAAALRHGFTVLEKNAPQKTTAKIENRETKTRPRRPLTYSCRECDEPDNDNMMMCDDHVAHQFTGEAWFHLACVGLKPDTVPGEIWYCPPCEYEKIFRAFG